MTIPYSDPKEEAQVRASVDRLVAKIVGDGITIAGAPAKITWSPVYWYTVSIHLKVDGVFYELVRMNFTEKSIRVRLTWTNDLRLFRLQGIEAPVDRVFRWLEPMWPATLAQIERDHRRYLGAQADSGGAQ